MVTSIFSRIECNNIVCLEDTVFIWDVIWKSWALVGHDMIEIVQEVYQINTLQQTPCARICDDGVIVWIRKRPSLFNVIITRLKGLTKTRYIQQLLLQSWSTVYNVGPASSQHCHWLNASFCRFNPYSAGIDFRRQNLTSVDVRFLRLKSILAL